VLHQPNDKLFKAVFGIPENARAFFLEQLGLPGRFCWDALEVVPSSFIDPRFASSEADLLYRVPKEKGPCLYILLEHQSSEDPRMAYRLLLYIAAIWRREENGELPPVLPCVLAQNRVLWKNPARLRVALPDWMEEKFRRLQPELEYLRVELAGIAYWELRGTAEGVLALRALKADPVGELLSDPVWDLSLLQSISPDALERFMRYIFDRNVSERVFLARLEVLKKEDAKLHYTLMTLAQQLEARGERRGRMEGRMEGREEGREEGVLNSRREAVLHAVRIRFGRVPKGLAGQLEQIHSVEMLDALLAAVIRARSERGFLKALDTEER
jgi:hypothetical protein